MQYTKLPCTLTAQIALLESRGMVFSDKVRAEHYLSHISYYRFRAYTFPYQNNADPNHPFWRSTPFEKPLNDYILDRKLRIIVFDALEKIEIALRTQIIYQLSIAHGGNWYENKNLFRNQGLWNKDLDNLDKEITRSQEEFIKHYKKKYTNPQRPPAWMAFEISTIGTLSKLYENLVLNNEKKLVATHFNLNYSVLESWMKTFSYIRNICAHHSRLWNRPLIVSPVLLKHPTRPWVDKKFLTSPQTLFSSLCCMRYFLNSISPGNNFSIKIQGLLAAYPGANLKTMGFSPNWEQEPLWR